MPGRFNPDDYVDVQDRIVRFWEDYPNGAIWTELLSSGDEFERVVIRAMVFKERPTESRHTAMPDASGIAAEMKGGNGANSTSWHENGETSAIGRALANLGYATSRSDRPSKQEMQKVERHEGSQVPPRGRTTTVNTVPADDWTAFWATLKARNIDGATYEAVVGKKAPSFGTTQAALDALRDAEAAIAEDSH